jgi:tripartite-type tricarboxylate transporter receptor subunit TctC
MAAFASVLVPGPAFAQESFYRDRTITIVVGYGPGGGFDQYSRLIARYLPKYVSGKPNVIVQNMPGAGSLQATNYVYTSAPKDGTVIANVGQDVASHQLMTPSPVSYDAQKFNWLGAVVASNSLVYTWRESGVQSWRDAQSRKVFLATTDISTMAVPRAMNALLNTQFQLVPGYAGTGEIKLALQRGEMMGSGGTTWAGLNVSSKELIDGKLINLLIQTGPAKEPDIPDVPLFSDLVTSSEDKELVSLLSLPNSIGYAYWLAPGVPQDRVAILQSAYSSVMTDADFLTDAKRQNLIIRSQTSAEIQARVQSAFRLSRTAIERTKQILGD